MSKTTSKVTKVFRKSFSLPNNNVMRWFPRHMNSSFLRMQAQFKRTDCVIEIHDARIPLSGRNPKFKSLIEMKPHILLLNKFDLCDSSLQENVICKLKSEGVENVLFTNSLKFKNQLFKNELVPTALEAIHSRPRFNREDEVSYNLMVIGVPNTGKSTFINALRRVHTSNSKKGVSTGAVPGVTRSVYTGMRVHFDPDIFLIDTPGILTPNIPDIEAGMKLSLCGCLPDHLVGVLNIVDYMLFWLNKHEHFNYVKTFNLTEPTDDVLFFLFHVAKQRHMIIRVMDKNLNRHTYVNKPDFHMAANHVLKVFRSGDLGKFTLDSDLL